MNTPCVDIDECLVDNGGCGAFADCTNTVGGRECACQDGFEGDGFDCVCIEGRDFASQTACGLNGRGTLQARCIDGQVLDTDICNDVDVCLDGEEQNGLTVCGLNGEGVLIQVCNAGQWLDSEACTGADVCVNEASQTGSTACGLNGRGALEQLCAGGQWVDTDECVDPDVCVDAAEQNGETVCGLNREGVLVQACVSGQWADTENCTGNHVCVNDATQEGDAECGINGRGLLIQDCVDGQWVDSARCNDPDVCLDGASEEGDTVCGLNNEGVLIQVCNAGQWVDAGEETCTGNDVCVNGTPSDGAVACAEGGPTGPFSVCTNGQFQAAECDPGTFMVVTCSDDQSDVDVQCTPCPSVEGCSEVRCTSLEDPICSSCADRYVPVGNFCLCTRVAQAVGETPGDTTTFSGGLTRDNDTGDLSLTCIPGVDTTANESNTIFLAGTSLKETFAYFAAANFDYEVIVFDASLDGTTLTLDFTTTLNGRIFIDGSGATLDLQGRREHFYLSGGEMHLQNLTLENGVAAGSKAPDKANFQGLCRNGRRRRWYGWCPLCGVYSADPG